MGGDFGDLRDKRRFNDVFENCGGAFQGLDSMFGVGIKFLDTHQILSLAVQTD